MKNIIKSLEEMLERKIESGIKVIENRKVIKKITTVMEEDN